LDVIASGGVHTIDDVLAARDANLAGVIIGRALYEGTIDLQQALKSIDHEVSQQLLRRAVPERDTKEKPSSS
jgi:copper homeostasis protein CutC